MARKAPAEQLIPRGGARKSRTARVKSRVDSNANSPDSHTIDRVALAPIRAVDTLSAALAALRARDPALIGAMLAVTGPPPLRLRPADLSGLIWIVIGQQVSTASASAIHARFQTGFPGCDPAALAAASDEALRACGLSTPKMRTLRALAGAVLEGALDFKALSAMSADEAHKRLVALHGIGPWTADLFLLSCLGHPDAWPTGDLALQEAARMVLKLRQRPDAKQLEKIGERWRPARAVAARLLWAWYGAMKGKG